MGFKSRKSGGNRFASIMDGTFRIRVDEDTEDAVERVLSKGDHKGESVWELHLDEYDGFLTGVTIRDGMYGQELQLNMTDPDTPAGEVGHSVTISVPVSSRHGNYFFQRMNGIDTNKRLSISPYSMEGKDQKTGKKTGKMVNGWVFRQDDEKLDSTLDPDDIPNMVEVKRKGKTEYDDDDRIEYYINLFDEWSDETTFKKFGDSEQKKSSKLSKKPKDDDDGDEGEEEKSKKKAKSNDKKLKKAKGRVVDDDEDLDDDDDIPF